MRRVTWLSVCALIGVSMIACSRSDTNTAQPKRCPAGSQPGIDNESCVPTQQSSTSTIRPTSSTTAAPSTTTTISKSRVLASAQGTPSVIEGFPVPSVAVLYAQPETKRAAVGTTFTTAKYSVEGVGVSDVKNWYQTNQAPLRDFGKWKWCEAIGDSDWFYSLPGTKDMLGYKILNLDEKSASGKNLVGIWVTTEDSGPC